MSLINPRVSIGLPVFNGENYLEEALESLLAQSFVNFELIISDNASADRTQEICHTYMLQDKRVRYYRNQTNLGVHKNWNRVFELSSGEYFKWAAHDDLYAPEFVERCVDALDKDPSIVLCFTKTKIIDEQGRNLRDYQFDIDTNSPRPHERFYNMLSVNHWCFQIFGVIRSNVLRMTPLHGNYFGSDRNLLAELSLYGPVYEIPEILFFRRDHRQSSNQLAMGKWERLVAYNPTRSSQTHFLALRRFREYAASIRRTSISRTERVLCYLELARLALEKSISRMNQNGARLAGLVRTSLLRIGRETE
jgi:glycosyltransferase involved in cell wall biosynthesis